MPTKPATVPTWATDANFASGPANAQPTKINPTGWPNVAQGAVAGSGLVAEMFNKLMNCVCSEWIAWVNGGNATGTADKHIVETDANGHTVLRTVKLTGGQGVVCRLGTLSGAADASFTAGNADSWFCTDGAADRVFTADETAETLQEGMRTRIWKKYTFTHTVTIQRFDGAANTQLAVLAAGSQCALDLVVRGGRLCVENYSPNVTVGADPGP